MNNENFNYKLVLSCKSQPLAWYLSIVTDRQLIKVTDHLKIQGSEVQFLICSVDNISSILLQTFHSKKDGSDFAM